MAQTVRLRIQQDHDTDTDRALLSTLALSHEPPERH